MMIRGFDNISKAWVYFARRNSFHMTWSGTSQYSERLFIQVSLETIVAMIFILTYFSCRYFSLIDEQFMFMTGGKNVVRVWDIA